jgi:hypothetical protein
MYVDERIVEKSAFYFVKHVSYNLSQNKAKVFLKTIQNCNTVKMEK